NTTVCRRLCVLFCRPHTSTLFPYSTLFRSIHNNPVSDAEHRAMLTGFFFWTSWAAAAERPGSDIIYTANWPHEPLIDNTPTTGISEEHTSELQSRENLVCRLLLDKKKRVQS